MYNILPFFCRTPRTMAACRSVRLLTFCCKCPIFRPGALCTVIQTLKFCQNLRFCSTLCFLSCHEVDHPPIDALPPCCTPALCYFSFPTMSDMSREYILARTARNSSILVGSSNLGLSTSPYYSGYFFLYPDIHTCIHTILQCQVL